jgi:hypothetical protein
LKANDELTKVIDEYRKKVGISDVKETPASPEATAAQPPAPIDTSASSLIDLGHHQENNGVSDANSSVLDDELKALGKCNLLGTVSVRSDSITSLSWVACGKL